MNAELFISDSYKFLQSNVYMHSNRSDTHMNVFGDSF